MIEYVSPTEILIEVDEVGRPVNPRGRVRDTTDLQASIQEAGGIVEPLLVRRGEDGRLWLVNGHRRLVAASRLGLTAVPVVAVEVRSGMSSRTMMLASDVRQAFPALVLDKTGTVIGGVAAAVREELEETGRTRESLARVMGIRPDVVSAYEQLVRAPVEVRRAVADGRLSINGFARMKHSPAEVQSEIVAAAEGEAVTVRAVREGLKQASMVQRTEEGVMYQEEDAVAVLNGVKARLMGVLAEGELGMRERFLLTEIGDIVRRGLEETAVGSEVK